MTADKGPLVYLNDVLIHLSRTYRETMHAHIYSPAEIMSSIQGIPHADSQETGWVPVTDYLPVLVPCSAGTAYSEVVNVLTLGRKVITAIWNGYHWICDAEFWDAEFEEITHWAPVILPLPEILKEG